MESIIKGTKPMKFKDKVAIVTGGASGIGEATVIEFAKEGAKVVISDIAVEAGEKLALRLTEQGHDVIFIETDVSSEEDIQQLIQKTIDSYGKLNIFFANAGINRAADAHELEFDAWKKVIDINLSGVFLSNKYAVKQFQAQKTGGVIINTGSVHSLVALEGQTANSASKGGVKMITQQVASTYAKEGIRANMIAPGYIDTPLLASLPTEKVDALKSLHPINRLGTSVEVAKAVLFLASDDASFISGVTLPIDGGYTSM